MAESERVGIKMSPTTSGLLVSESKVNLVFALVFYPWCEVDGTYPYSSKQTKHSSSQG